MDIQRAAELLAARSTKDFGNALKDRGDPFKDFYKSLPICILDAVFSIGVRYTSVVNVVNSYMATFDLTIRPHPNRRCRPSRSRRCLLPDSGNSRSWETIR